MRRDLSFLDHVQRGMDLVANQDKPVSKAIMASYLIAATTLAGAMLLETRDMLSGKDPRKINGADWLGLFLGASFISGARWVSMAISSMAPTRTASLWVWYLKPWPVRRWGRYRRCCW